MEIIYRLVMVLICTLVLQYFLNKVIIIKTWYNSWIAKTFLFSGYSTIMLLGQVFTKKHRDNFNEIESNHEAIHGRQWIELFSLSFSIFCQLLCFSDISFNFFLWGILISIFAFYIIYLLEYGLSFVIAFLFKKESVLAASENGYQCSMLEQEAYGNEEDMKYLKERKPFISWLKFFGNIYKKK